MSQSNESKSLPSVKIERAKGGAPSDAPETPVERAAREFSQQHDERSFEVLCHEAEPHLKGAITHAGIRKQDVGDVLNKVLLLIWQRREQFAGTAYDFECFGVAISAKEVLKWRRSQARWTATAVLSRRDDAPSPGTEHASNAYDPETMAAMDEALRALPERERHVLRAHGEGYSWDEIAGQLRVSENRVRQIHARAVRRIREEQ